jgi:hypothetical protein
MKMSDLLTESSTSVGGGFVPHLSSFASVASTPWTSMWRARRTVLHIPAELAQQPWFDALFSRCQDLLALPSDWDSYGAHPVNVETLERILALLAYLPIADLPSIVPLHDGGLQIEWHTANADVEIDIHPRGAISALIETGEREEEWSLLSQPDVERLQSVLGTLFAP